MKNMLVVIDMVNGFVNFGNLADKRINKITPKIAELIENAIKNNEKIIAFCDSHHVNDVEFQTFPEHCLEGSLESELIPELKVYEPYMQVIKKSTTDGFKTEEFKQLIENNKFETITVCGCCTDICVQNFCASLNQHLKINNINTKIVVESEAVDTFDAPNHNADDCNKKALKEMKQDGVIIAKSKE